MPQTISRYFTCTISWFVGIEWPIDIHGSDLFPSLSLSQPKSRVWKFHHLACYLPNSLATLVFFHLSLPLLPSRSPPNVHKHRMLHFEILLAPLLPLLLNHCCVAPLPSQCCITPSLPLCCFLPKSSMLPTLLAFQLLKTESSHTASILPKTKSYILKNRTGFDL
jgi:hypothetical protein